MRRAVESVSTLDPDAVIHAGSIADSRMLFVCGQELVDPEWGNRVGGSMVAQTQQALHNLRVVLDTADGRLENGVKITAHIVDLDRWGRLDAAYTPESRRRGPRCDAISRGRHQDRRGSSHWTA